MISQDIHDKAEAIVRAHLGACEPSAKLADRIAKALAEERERPRPVSEAMVERAWHVYLCVDPQTWGISHMRAALEAALSGKDTGRLVPHHGSGPDNQ